MKFVKRILSFVTAAGMLSTAAVCFSFDRNDVNAASVVSLSPNNRYDINNGIFEGWGTSLCWWANRVGYSDVLAEKSAELFFGLPTFCIPALWLFKLIKDIKLSANSEDLDIAKRLSNSNGLKSNTLAAYWTSTIPIAALVLNLFSRSALSSGTFISWKETWNLYFLVLEFTKKSIKSAKDLYNERIILPSTAEANFDWWEFNLLLDIRTSAEATPCWESAWI